MDYVVQTAKVTPHLIIGHFPILAPKKLPDVTPCDNKGVKNQVDKQIITKSLFSASLLIIICIYFVIKKYCKTYF